MSESNKQPDIHVRGSLDMGETSEMHPADGETPWVKSQEVTFTRWVNQHLKKIDMTIENLREDFADGVKLAALVEVLTGKKLKGINRKPKFMPQKVENISNVLKYIEEFGGVKLISIDSSHIMNGNIKMILGLLWKMIIKYSISVPMMDVPATMDELAKKEEEYTGPRKRLLKWINHKLPDSVDNLTRSWNDGKKIGALVESIAPGLCSDWVDWDERQPLSNATEAMTLAERWLNVAQLITPEEMIDSNVDEKAMMTYLSQFITASVQEGAPVRAKVDPTRVVVSGSGLEHGRVLVDSPAEFTVDVSKAGTGQLGVLVLNPKGVQEACNVRSVDSEGSAYRCTYVPRMKGEHRIIIKYGGREVSHSPFHVHAQEPRGDPKKVSVQGPALDHHSSKHVDSSVFFNVLTRGAGPGTVECVIVDPEGRRDTISPKITCPDSPDNYLVEFVPKMTGAHKVLVYFAGEQVPGSPFPMEVTPAFRPELAYLTGRGVQPNGIRAQDHVTFQVHTELAGYQAALQTTMVRSDGEIQPIDVKQIDAHLWECSYVAQRPGKYTLNVLYGSKPIQGSPVSCVIGPYKKSDIRTFGSGLTGGIVGQPAVFFVKCNGESDQIQFSVEGPSEAQMDCQSLDNGTARVTYTVTKPGEYAVHVVCGGEYVPGAPFMVPFSDEIAGIDPKKLRISGAGVNKATPLHVGQRASFTVDGVSDAISDEILRSNELSSLLHATCHDSTGEPIPVEMEIQPDGSVVFSYSPVTWGTHTVSVDLCSVPIKGTPCSVNVRPAVKVENIKLWGPGLKEVIQRQPAHFIADVRGAFSDVALAEALAENPFSMQLTDDYGNVIPVRITEQQVGVYRIDYTVNSMTENIHVTPVLGQFQCTEHPTKVRVRSDVDVSGISITGMESKVYKGSYMKFGIDASAVDRVGRGEVAVVLVKPNGDRLACPIQNHKDGTYTCSYTPVDEGIHELHVTYDGIPVPGGPFKIGSIPGCDPSRVKVYGPGVEDGNHIAPNKQTEFTIDLVGAGEGSLGLSVEGPCEAPIECRNNDDGTCTVYYTPTEAGMHSIHVKFGETDVTNSPFHVNVRDVVDPQQVQCYGHGLESGLVRAGWPAYFTVDTKRAGSGKLQVMYSSHPDGPLRHAVIQPLATTSGKELSQSQNYHKVTYTPDEEGMCYINVLYDGEHVPNSPFAIQIRKDSEPERVRVFGVDKEVLASFPCTFTVDARDAGRGDLTLSVVDPRGQSVPVRVVPMVADNDSVLTNGAQPSVVSLASGDVTDTGLLSCTYEPFVLGVHSIHMMFAKVPVNHTPIIVNCIPTGDAEKCFFKSEVSEKVIINEEVVMTVDTSAAGKGRLTCTVVQQPFGQPSSAATILPVEREDNGDGTVNVYFTPTQFAELSVEIGFGGHLIPDGKFTQKVVTPDEFDAQIQSAIFRPVEFCFPPLPAGATVEAIVVAPSGAQHSVPLQTADDGNILLVYQPEEEGMFELQVNEITEGSSTAYASHSSPYRFFVDNMARKRITAYGPGLSHGIAGNIATFDILTASSGGGGLTVAVEGPSKCEISCKDNGDGTCSVSYLPLVPGEYTIVCKFGDRHIPGSPFIAKITGEVMQRAQLSMEAPTDFPLEAMTTNFSELVATVRSPSGVEEPCGLKRLPNNRLGISFSPKEVGEHTISVCLAGKNIANSPFKLNVSENEIGNAELVSVTGPGIESGGLANQPNYFIVDTRNAGFAGLSVAIEGPTKADIECIDNHDGTCKVIYTVVEPGDYAISVKYANEHVPNGPFHVNIGGERRPTRHSAFEQSTKGVQALSSSITGGHYEVNLRVQTVNLSNLQAFVTYPSGMQKECELVHIDSEHYKVNFTPEELGEHLVTVKHQGVHISGSPFPFLVTSLTGGSSEKVRAFGAGLKYGLTNVMNEFVVDTLGAGAGRLAIDVEGPGEAVITCTENTEGSSRITYKVGVPGVYKCSVKFNDENIPHSPFRIQISEKPERITPHSRPVAYAAPPADVDNLSHVGRPIAFTVHHEESLETEMLKAKVIAPSGLMEDAIVNPIGRHQYAVYFVPHENGPHYIHVHSVPKELADDPDLVLGPESSFKSITGSPFRLIVSQHTADPAMVYAHGEGLYRGKVDAENFIFVNTVNAGSGVLNVTIDGPSKVYLSSHDHEEGYKFVYIPPIPGIYDISIKYGGNFHIAGSPFTAEVTGTPKSMYTDDTVDRQSNVILDTVGKTSASYQNAAVAVRCQGLGLKRASIDHENYFNVDAKGTAAEVLMVGINGPTQPVREVRVKYQGNSQYTVTYRVSERGKHSMFVKWGERHVTGSPFEFCVP